MLSGNKKLRYQRVIIFCSLLFLILFSIKPTNAQDDDFPVGLYLVYNNKWKSGGIGIYEDSVTIRYDFLDWINESSDFVEVTKNGEALHIRYPSDTLYIGTDVPLWIDTRWSNTWTDGSNISFCGQTLKVSRSTREVEAGSFSSWYLSVDFGLSGQKTYIRYYYDVNLGFLIIYIWTETKELSFNQRVYELAETNLKDFMFLGGSLSSPFVTVLLSIGIGFEVLIVIILIIRRMKYH